MDKDKKDIKVGTAIEFEVRMIDDRDPAVQKDMVEVFEKTVMYLNIVDPDNLPDEVRETVLKLTKIMSEEAW